MPLLVPNLDDRTYDDLLAEALRYLPTFAPDWTNHNPSDPGITVIELLSYVTELLVYRSNVVGDDHLAAFLRLLTGSHPEPGLPFDEQIRRIAMRLRQTKQAVCRRDFEHLAKIAVRGRVARAHCLPGLDLNRFGPDVVREGNVSVIVVPIPERGDRSPVPDPELRQQIRLEMETARLLTTWLHICPPSYRPIHLSAKLTLEQNASGSEVRKAVEAALHSRFDAVGAPPTYAGWPFGKTIYALDLYRVIEDQPGVGSADDLRLDVEGEQNRIEADASGNPLSVHLKANELPVLHVRELLIAGSGEEGAPSRG